MNEFVLTAGVVVFVIYAAFHIAYLVEMRKTSLALRRFVSEAGNDLEPALSALAGVLGNIGKATYNIVVLTERARELAERAAALERAISGLYDSYAETAGEAARAHAAGLKAGVKAGMTTLLKSLNTRKEGSS